MQENLAFRKATAKDLAYIVTTWLDSYKMFNKDASNILDEIYFDQQRKLILDIIQRSTILIVGLADKSLDNPDKPECYGYLVYERLPSGDSSVLCLHYAFVKTQWRSHGILTNMLKEAGHNKNKQKALSTHNTKFSQRINEKMGVLYNNYILKNIKGE